MKTKNCSRCKKRKSIKLFGIKDARKKQYQSLCRPCNKVYQHEHYKKNKERYTEATRALRRKRQLQLLDYLSSHPCTDCGEPDPIVLEFDHVRSRKTKAVTDLARNCCTWEKIHTEIAKCEVRCANCHRRKTFKSVQSYRIKGR